MKSPIFKVVLEREKRFGVDVSDISVYICLVHIRDGSNKPVYGGVDDWNLFLCISMVYNVISCKKTP